MFSASGDVFTDSPIRSAGMADQKYQANIVAYAGLERPTRDAVKWNSDSIFVRHLH